MQLPIGAEANYKGVVDLLTMKALVWSGEELGAKWDDGRHPRGPAGAGRASTATS